MRPSLLLLVPLALTAQAPLPSAQEVLARAKAAMGGEAWDRVAALELRGRLHTAGLDGTLVTLEEVTTGRQVTHFDLGATRGANGSNTVASWDLDESGDVQMEEGDEARKDFLDQRYDTLRAYWFQERMPGKVSFLGTREEGGRRYDVLKVEPGGAFPHELWVDAADGTFARTVAVRQGRTQTTTFSDYRLVEGLKLPFRMVTTSGDPAFDTRIQLEAVAVNPKVAPGAFDPPRPDLGAFGVEGGGAEAVVPLEFKGQHLLVQVTLNGHGPYRFFLDTGGANVIAPSVARALGLKPEGSVQGMGIGEKAEAFGLTKVARVGLGSAWMGDQSFLVIPSIEGIGKRMGLDVSGVVGYELFRRFVARIDRHSTRLTLCLPDRWSYAGGGVAVPFTFSGHQPQVAGELDGVPGRFDLDTGAGNTLSVYTPFAKAHHLKEQAGRTLPVPNAGVGGETWEDVYRAHELKLGGVSMPAPLVDLANVASGAFAKEGAIGNVGQGFLHRFDLILDYPHQRIIFEKNDTWSEPDRFSMTGILPSPDLSGRIRRVYPGSPAADAGLKPDDIVLTVDGHPFKDLGPDELRRLATQAPGTRLTLRVRSGAAERTVVLVLREIL